MDTRKPFLVCIDSDGCMFDNMELKHKECFCPATVNVWNLQSVSRYAREVWEYVNLYSRMRGENRFPAIADTLALLAGHPGARARGYRMPDISALKRFIRESPILSAKALDDFIAVNGATEDLLTAKRWSAEVNANVDRIVRNVAPFPSATKALETLRRRAHIAIVSQTQTETIRREWAEHGLLPLADEVNGQEVGSKADCITKARGLCYDTRHTLMIGDAPGDAAAAETAGALFYPIVPGREDESWTQLESLSERFFSLDYEGESTS